MTLLTVNDMATRLQVKEKTLYAWASQGKIPCVKVNGVIRFDAREIEQWLEGCRVRAKAHSRLSKSASRDPRQARENLDLIVERAKQAVYTQRHGETRPTASPHGKEGKHGAR